VPPASGGPAVEDPCAYLTATEVAGTSRTPADEVIIPTPHVDDPADCQYGLADAGSIVTVIFQREGAATAYHYNVEGTGSGEQIADIGESAYYFPDGNLRFFANDLYVNLTAGYAGNSQNHEDSRAGTIALAKLIAARLAGTSIPPELQITAPPVVNAEAACDLLTGEEAASVLDKGAMEATGNASAPAFCTYSVTSTDEILASTYFKPTEGISFYGDLENSLTVDPVSGIGDKAMFEPGTGILYVLKNDSVFNVNVFGVDPTDALEPDQQLAEIMLTHL